MATEQDWTAYSDQDHVKTTDTWLLRTSAGAGAEVAGIHAVTRRASGGDYTANGSVILIPTAGWTAGQSVSLFVGDTATAITATNGSFTLFKSFNDIVFATSGSVTEVFRLTAVQEAKFNAIVEPAFDNVFRMGGAAKRWTVVYAATGTINTSDEREKEWRGGLTDAEVCAARRIAGELGFYRWIDAIAEKGDAARFHFGARAQAVWRIMADEGLIAPIGNDGLPGATPYAFLCFDQWEDSNRFGLRVDQLALFLIAAQEQRLLALEAA